MSKTATITDSNREGWQLVQYADGTFTETDNSITITYFSNSTIK